MTAPSVWRNADELLQLNTPPAENFSMPIQSRRRRSYDKLAADGRASLHLVDDDGMRRWIYQAPLHEQTRGRAGRSPLVHVGDVLETFRYVEEGNSVTGSNRITTRLVALDKKLTPNQGLRRLNDNDELVFVDQEKLKGNILLLVHGTFSNSDMYLKQWNETDSGKKLLVSLKSRYAHILAFDHPTLSVAPWINALALHSALKNVTGQIDVLAHSRGGLVVSWWLRLVPSRVGKVIFTGSPLEGTSLASPHRIRIALDHMATMADLLAVGGMSMSGILPLAAGVAGLAKIFGAALRLGSNLPLVDSAIAMIPGLASQQRIDNNLEHQSLFAEKWLPNAPTFMAIQANFQPDSSQVPLWRVWDKLKSVGTQLAAGAADSVFGGANDLVVDTGSMTFLGDHHAIEPRHILNLGSGNTFHTNYFTDDRVTKFLQESLAKK